MSAGYWKVRPFTRTPTLGVNADGQLREAAREDADASMADVVEAFNARRDRVPTHEELVQLVRELGGKP